MQGRCLVKKRRAGGVHARVVGRGRGALPTHDVLTIELGTVLRLRCGSAALDKEAGARRLPQIEGPVAPSFRLTSRFMFGARQKCSSRWLHKAAGTETRPENMLVSATPK